MKITFDWLKDHLNTNLKEEKLLEKLTDIGLEVESVENLSASKELFKIAKIIKQKNIQMQIDLKFAMLILEKKELMKIVCGASNAREGLITIYTSRSYYSQNKNKTSSC